MFDFLMNFTMMHESTNFKHMRFTSYSEVELYGFIVTGGTYVNYT